MSKFFIERPIFSTVISLVILLVGAVSIFNLPIEQYPDLTPPSIQVSAQYPGASAEVIASTIAAPLEQQINGASDMIYMNSISSSSGNMSLLVYFKVGVDPDLAMMDVNNRVQGALGTLPADVQAYGVKVNKKSSAMLQIISFTSPDGLYDTTYIGNYALVNIVDELKRVEGVGDASVMSANDYSIRIWLKPDVLSKLKLTPADIYSVVKEQNAQRAAGKIGQPPLLEEVERTYMIVAPGRLETPEEFANIIVRANADGSTLRLKDVADIELGSQTYEFEGSNNKVPSVPVAIYLSPGANSVATAEAVGLKMQELAAKLPSGIEYKVAYDTTIFVSESIKEVIHTLFEAMVLVFLVVFLFLKDWRATVIPCLAVPVSIVGAFAGMMGLGFSINTLTLFGVVLAIGIVVDDAIVVIENVERIMSEEKLPVKEATIKAMEEVTGPVVAIVLVLCSVFVPVAFMGGFAGEMYKQFAITIAVSVVISGIVALTLTPALCVMLLKHEDKKYGGFFGAFDRFFDMLTEKYTKAVSFFIKRMTVAFAVVALVLAGVVIMFKVVPSTLLPDEDQGMMMASLIMDPGSSLSQTKEAVAKVEDIILAHEDIVDQEMAFAGFDMLSSSQKANNGAFFILLKPWDERKKAGQSAADFIQTLAVEGNAKLTNALFMPFNPPAIQGLSTTGGLEGYIQNKGSGGSRDLSDKVTEFIAAASQKPALSSVTTTFSTATPQYQMKTDNTKARSMGVNINDLYVTMQSTFGTMYVNDFTKFGRSFKVIMQARGDYRARAEQLREVFVRSSKGEMVPVSSLASLTPVTGPDTVERFNVFPAAKVMATPAPGYSSGDAIKAMEETAAEVLGADYNLSWFGTTFQEQGSGSTTVVVLILALILVFLVLAAQYERWSLPFAVLSAVPFAIFGALAGIYMRGIYNDIYFQIAMIALIGLAAKNAILIVEFAIINRQQGMSLTDSAVQAAKMRFRPIVMTSLAFILGCVPLMISSGAGAASRHSIGTAVVCGMLGATLIAPLFIPWFFVIFSKISGEKDAAVKIEDTKQEG
ncbi:hydrophobe/amphiphile efflux-1 (HAE1) family protein [Elusimicrobium posterum]|uniref:efflux RND transporter permease subunit n=1 Tax=Elusimicrobium posterum TaxID=3116653 RepID=UPI003C73B734